MKKEVIKKDDVSNFISQAIENRLPVEAMERLFTLYKEVKKEKAKEAFVTALAEFQKKSPIIQKTKKVLNKDGKTIRYMYAPIDSVIEQIKKPLSDSGLSYNWDSYREDNHIKVICKLTHIAGHTETSTFDIPIVPSQYMTSPQSYATALTYAKRYTLLDVLGIATAEEDTDAADTGKDQTPPNPKAKIMLLLRELGEEPKTKKEVEKVVKKITDLMLEPKNYGEIISRLEVAIAQKYEDKNIQ